MIGNVSPSKLWLYIFCNMCFCLKSGISSCPGPGKPKRKSAATSVNLRVNLHTHVHVFGSFDKLWSWHKVYGSVTKYAVYIIIINISLINKLTYQINTFSPNWYFFSIALIFLIYECSTLAQHLPGKFE